MVIITWPLLGSIRVRNWKLFPRGILELQSRAGRLSAQSIQIAMMDFGAMVRLIFTVTFSIHGVLKYVNKSYLTKQATRRAMTQKYANLTRHRHVPMNYYVQMTFATRRQDRAKIPQLIPVVLLGKYGQIYTGGQLIR